MKNRRGGFCYEVDRGHPVVQQMMKANPGTGASLNVLLQQIEVGLPFSQSYVDLRNDEQIANDGEQSDVEVVESLQEMVTVCVDKQEKRNLLSAIACIEPYSVHYDILTSSCED